MSRRHPVIYTKVNEPADVRVLLPYLKTSYQLQMVVDCLRIQRVQPELHKVGPGDEYWRLLRDTWAEGKQFFIVEHDVAVWQGGIRALAECAEDWCTYPTMCHGRMVTTTFGAVKFGAQLIERNPGFFSDIPPTWFHLDSGFADKMGWPYIRPHAHWPPATHLNEVQWADEISTRYTLERKLVWQSMENGGEPVAKATNTADEVSVGTVRWQVAER
jgi:hypothetical protein